MQYWPTTRPIGQQSAPGMRIHQSENNPNNFVLVFSPGDEVLSGILQFAQEEGIVNAHFTAIGALSQAKVGWFDNRPRSKTDRSRGGYKINDIPFQTEMTSLIGNITVFNDQVTIHAHVNVADENGIVMGGHALELFVYPTVELFLETDPTPLVKHIDPEVGLAVID